MRTILITFTLLFTVQSSFCQGCPTKISFTSQSEIDAFSVDYPNCKTIPGDVEIMESSNGNITSLAGLSKITSVGGSLVIIYTAILKSLAGLEGLTTVGSAVVIGRNSSLKTLEGLKGLTTVGSNLSISKNPLLTKFGGLSQLTTVSGDLKIEDNAQLRAFEGLNEITTIGGSLVIGGNYVLTGLSELKKLKNVGESIYIYGNYELTSLKELSGIKAIYGDLGVVKNDELNSLEGLQNINPTTIANLFIQSSKKLSVCNLPNLCTFLADPNNTATISKNAIGCATREEITKSCIVSANDVNENQQKIQAFPNPTSNILNISGSNFENGSYQMELSNIVGQIIHSEQISVSDKMIQKQLSLANYSSGLYFLTVKNGRSDKTIKVLKVD